MMPRAVDVSPPYGMAMGKRHTIAPRFDAAILRLMRHFFFFFFSPTPRAHDAHGASEDMLRTRYRSYAISLLLLHA